MNWVDLSQVGGFKHDFYCPFHIWDVIRNPLTNSIIFQRGRYTTNQKWYKADPCICPKRAFAHDVSQNWLQEPWGSCNLSHRKFRSFFKPNCIWTTRIIHCFEHSMLIVNYQVFIVDHSLFRLNPTHRVIKLRRFPVKKLHLGRLRRRLRRQHIGCLWRSAGPVVCWISSKDFGMLGKTTYTIWLFNIAMGNGPFIEVYLLKIVIFHGYVK